MRQRRNRIERQVPPQLQPDVVANVVVDLALQASRFERLTQFGDARRKLLARLPEIISVAICVTYDTRRNDLSCRIHRAANRPVRTDLRPLFSARIDALNLHFSIASTQSVEIPPWNSILGGHNRCVRPKQRPHLLSHFPGLMRFQCAEHIVLRSKIGWIARRRHPRNLLDRFPVDISNQLQAIGFDRFEIGTTRHERNVNAGKLHQHADMRTDRARAINANLHKLHLNLRSSFVRLVSFNFGLTSRAHDPTRCASGDHDPNGLPQFWGCLPELPTKIIVAKRFNHPIAAIARQNCQIG